MTGSDPRPFFEQVLLRALGQTQPVTAFQFLGGSRTTQTVWVRASDTFFLKWREDDPAAALATEARSLALLRDRAGLTVPEVLGQGEVAGRHYLLLSYVDERPRADLQPRAAAALAQLHVCTRATFGLAFDTYLADQRQCNDPTPDVATFWAERRLRPAAGLAHYQGLLPVATLRQLDRLCARLPEWLPRERPALLHGNLQARHLLSGPHGPVWIDPAPCYGPREAELAHARLLGRFEQDFFEVYAETFPLEPGFEARLPIYQLYPLLLLLLSEGDSYRTAVEHILNKYA